MDSVEGCDLAHIFRDLSQIEKLSEIKQKITCLVVPKYGLSPKFEFAYQNARTSKDMDGTLDPISFYGLFT